jgi:hypothetical protein
MAYPASSPQGVQTLMDGNRYGMYGHHLLGDLDKLFETDCYRKGALDPYMEFSTGGRRVVRSVPLF